MGDGQPSWADLHVAPAPKPSRKRALGIGCGSLFGVVVILGVLGSLIGAPKPSPTARGTVAAAPARSPSASPTLTPTRGSAPAPTPSASKTGLKAVAAPAQPKVDLVFSGGITGSATQVDDVLPTKTGAHYDYTVPEGATQCVMPADDGAWSANVIFHVNGISWNVAIGAPGFGLPKAGSHPALPQTLTGGSSDDPNAVSLWVGSDKSPDNVGGGSGIGRYSFSYYTPMEHNNGAGTIVINKNLTSGTIDVWLTPSQPDNLQFHVTGNWSCA